MLSRFFFLKCAFYSLVVSACLFQCLGLTGQQRNNQDILFDGRDPGAIRNDSIDQVYVKQEFDKNMWPALKSLAVPGWGQIHNKQWRKAPVIWGATALVLGSGLNSRSNFIKKRDAINSRLSGFQTDEYWQEKTGLALRFDAQDARVRYRWSMAALGFVHLLNVADAYSSAYILKTEKAHSPTGAALRSAIIPGWGQVYNKRIWKVPLVAGAMATAGYFIWWNTKEHRVFRDELFARRFGRIEMNVEGATFTIPYSATNPYNTSYNDLGFFGVSDERLLQARDFYLDQLDTAILVGVLVYALNIVDAAVDAHLRDFDIDDDLGTGVEGTSSISPAVFPNGALGLNWQLTF